MEKEKEKVDMTVYGDNLFSVSLLFFVQFLEHVSWKKQFNLKPLSLSFVVLINSSFVN